MATTKDPRRAAKDAAASTRRAYESDATYKTATICGKEIRNSNEYSERLLNEKLDIVRRHLTDGLLVDLCCATGEHIWSLRRAGCPVVGLDFSIPFLNAAERKRHELKESGVSFVAADARSLPLASRSVSTIYSLSALYQVPDIERVIGEISRVLQKGGRCVLDLGNSQSINSYCVRHHYTELPASYHIPVARMRALCNDHGLRIIEHRAFQILPLWADRPRWLWPLLHPFWKWLLAKRVAGRMLDEWISNFWPLKQFAFRHVLVCEKH
jgi:SAM-dependent methyltransferase